MKDTKHMTNEELLKEYKLLDELIHGRNPCFGSKDVLRALHIENEMAKREAIK